MIFRAIKLVSEAHAGQYRKGTKIPYMVHLLNVMKILYDQHCDVEMLTAAILHDVVEDTSITIEEVEARFGSRVAFLVKGATEPERLNKNSPWQASWKERKQHTLDFLLYEATADQMILAVADKLDNAQAIQQDFEKLGDRLWKRFNAGKEQQKWYYQSLVRVFDKKAKEVGEPLITLAYQLEITVEKVFGSS